MTSPPHTGPAGDAVLRMVRNDVPGTTTVWTASLVERTSTWSTPATEAAFVIARPAVLVFTIVVMARDVVWVRASAPTVQIPVPAS